MYKVFFNDRAVFLSDSFLKNYVVNNGLFYKYHNKNDLKFLLDRFERSQQLQQLFVHFDDLNELQFQFKSCFTYVEAAGGIVKNKAGQVLIIRRFEKWDLPKGKIKENEDYKSGALREVEEETGISGMTITGALSPTWHTYRLNNESILKKTHWFEMHYSGSETLTPQADEGITDVKWINSSEIAMVAENTYASILDVLKEGMPGSMK